MGWEQIESMLKENRDQALTAVSEPPATCPICGRTLDVRGMDAVRNCMMGHYTWRG